MLEKVKNILSIFISETENNIHDLEKAKEKNNTKEIANIAHKMLPMFKQLQVANLVSKLLKLERDSESFDQKTITIYVKILIQEINNVLEKIKKI